MTSWRRKRMAVALAAVGAVALAGLGVATQGGGGGGDQAGPRYVGYLEKIRGESEDEEHGIPDSVGGPSSESSEIYNSITSVANARLAPYGSVAAGQLSSSLGYFKGMDSTTSRWGEVTNLPYDADDPNYRDPQFSNSSGGAGFEAGRITGLAAGEDKDGNAYLFAGGANGGVFRKALNDVTNPSDDGDWQPISDGILSLSTGDLEFHDGALWYATGEANTGGTSYVGSGVYRNDHATDPSLDAAQFTEGDLVGGTELESRGINKVRFDDKSGLVYAATTRGLWRHSSVEATGAWDRVFMPNESADTDIKTPYKNIVNDVAIDDNGGVLVNAAWRSGDASYNGFYYSADGAGPYAQVNPQGALGYQQVGNTEFAWGTDGQGHKKVLYAVVESPTKLAHSPQTVLYGVFKSPSGKLAGPWNKIADSAKFQASGSAFQGGNGVFYRPGVQAWYNNFIETEPGHPDHVWVGLEEVYESKNGGTNWTTPGPYWNFGLKCWNISDQKNQCHETTHSDQHSIVVFGGRVYVGNDGGVKSRPVNGTLDKYGHADDWQNLSPGLRTLQYYSVGVGTDQERGGVAVAGGLQDNGGSLLRGDRQDNEGHTEMVSPFGGDGGDIIVNPKNGCQILDEYVFLTLWMTKNCGQSDGTEQAVYDVSVPDANPRFTAPFRAIRGSQDTGDEPVEQSSERWIAGGNAIWTHDRGFSITPEEIGSLPNHGWTKQTSLPKGSEMIVGLDAMAGPDPKDSKQDAIVAAWCGESNCNSAGFTRGVRTNIGSGWHELDLDTAKLPERYPNAVWLDNVTWTDGKPATATVYLVFNGYNRRFIEGPGSRQDHVWKGEIHADGKVAWTNESTSSGVRSAFPDVPATDVLRIGDKLVVGTDYGVMIGDLNGSGDVTSWKRVGGESGAAGALPLTTVMDLTVGPKETDGKQYLYAATHGRGIWKTPVGDL